MLRAPTFAHSKAAAFPALKFGKPRATLPCSSACRTRKRPRRLLQSRLPRKHLGRYPPDDAVLCARWYMVISQDALRAGRILCADSPTNLRISKHGTRSVPGGEARRGCHRGGAGAVDSSHAAARPHMPDPFSRERPKWRRSDTTPQTLDPRLHGG